MFPMFFLMQDGSTTGTDIIGAGRTHGTHQDADGSRSNTTGVTSAPLRTGDVCTEEKVVGVAELPIVLEK